MRVESARKIWVEHNPAGAGKQGYFGIEIFGWSVAFRFKGFPLQNGSTDLLQKWRYTDTYWLLFENGAESLNSRFISHGRRACRVRMMIYSFSDVATTWLTNYGLRLTQDSDIRQTEPWSPGGYGSWPIATTAWKLGIWVCLCPLCYYRVLYSICGAF